ncbi:GTPase IMAP family member 8-like [Syngnathus typhle]
MANPEELNGMPEQRLVIIGARGEGKSSAANTILTKQRFECSRTQTQQAEARHGVVEGRNLVLVDTPGWKRSPSLNEIPERDKQQFKLYASKCQPGPHAFLLVVPTDASFSHKEKKAVLDYMKLLGNRVWSYTMVLFTFGDYLGNKTIEQHIESEGAALTWLIGKCNDRYHVLNNKDKSNLSQVTELLEKIDEMVRENNDGFYMLDSSVFHAIQKRDEVAKKAQQRLRKALEKQEELNKIISEMKPIQKLQIILLGSRAVGKTFVINTILGISEPEDETTVLSQLHEGRVGRMEIAVVDTPGWRKGSPARDTSEMIKDEVVHSLLKCRPGPDVFLLVIDADASFNRWHLKAATTHVELFGKNVWKHTMVVFTRGDSRRIEEYIEYEGKSLQYLLEICGNRYHVLDNTNDYDGAQVDKLLEKILQTLAGNDGQHFAPKKEMVDALREKEKKVQLAVDRRTQLKATRGVKGPTKTLHEIKILILGERKSGKTTAANLILRDKVFPTQANHVCMARQAPVADWQVTVVDTPGWAAEESQSTPEQDREIVSGLTVSPQGFDAVLIVWPLDLKFREANHDALVDHITLLGDKIWNHTIVLFTNEDTLADKSLEEYIKKEDQALRQLVDKCGNNYHCLNILETRDDTQLVQLFKKIEDMSAKNQGRLFCPNMDDIYRSIDEKFLKRNLNMRVQALTSQRLELLREHKTKLENIHDNIKEIVPSPLPQNRAKKKSVLSDIEEQIHKLGTNIMKLNKSTNSMDVPLNLNQSTPEMDKVLEWTSKHQRNTDNYNSTLDMSESSGYGSLPVFPLGD